MEIQVDEKKRSKAKKEKNLEYEGMSAKDLSQLIRDREATAKMLREALEDTTGDVKIAAERISLLEERIRTAECDARAAYKEKGNAEMMAIEALNEQNSLRRKNKELEEQLEQRRKKIEALKVKKREVFEEKKILEDEVKKSRKFVARAVAVTSEVLDSQANVNKIQSEVNDLKETMGLTKEEIEKQQTRPEKAEAD